MTNKGGSQGKMKKQNSNGSPKSREKGEEEQHKKKGNQKGGKKNAEEKGNGFAIQNGKKDKNKNPKRTNSYSQTSKQSGWSALAYINVFLLMVLLVLSGSLLFLCSNGDFSVEGVKSSWPCIKENAYRLRNMSMEVINKENLLALGHLIWVTSVRGLEHFIHAAKVFFGVTSEFLQRWAKELSPYMEPLMPYIFEITHHINLVFEWLTNPEYWSTAYEFLIWLGTSIFEQLLVLKEELKRNVALTGICDKVDNWSLLFWNSTSPIRSTILSLYTNASTQWVPYYANQASNLVSSMRLTIENFFK